VSPVVNRIFDLVRRLERWVARHFVLTVVIGIAIVVLEQLMFGFRQWIPVSASMTFIVGLALALRLPAYADDAIERLSRRQVLVREDEPERAGTVTEAADLGREVADSVETWSRWVAVVTAVAVFTAMATGLLPERQPAMVLVTVAAFLAGRVFGRAIALAGLGRRIETGEWTLRMQPGHIDGAAGLRPAGSLYFRQAMVVAIPVAWLAIVSILKTVSLSPQRHVYVGMLVIAIALEVATFIVPMLSFHRIMKDEKRRLLLEADQHSAKLHRLEHELPDITDDTRRQAVGAQVAGLRERYRRLERLPTWPVDASIWRRFEINNALLLIPVAIQAISAVLRGEWWTRLGEILGVT
jgi:hypothetical protein